jgi:hypothetical protein
MKKIDLGQSISIVANVGVIAGLLLLAFELRQNNEALGLQARLEREDTLRQGLTRRLNNSDLIRAAAKAIEQEELSLEEELLLEDYNRGAMVDWWLAYRQVQDGALDEATLPVSLWSTVFREGTAFPRMDESWAEFKLLFPQEVEYIQWFEENVVNE